MHDGDLLALLASVAPSERDAVVEGHLDIDGSASSAAPGADLVGYHASGVASIVRMSIEVPVTEDDVFVDLGSGLGKVVLLTHLLTGATARGIELQSDLVERARRAAARLDLDVRFVHADVRVVVGAELDDGTVFFLYAPFTGAVLGDVVQRLHTVASRRPIVVCALGVDLERVASWLVRRDVDAFWLTIYDSVVPGVPARPPRSRAPSLGEHADVVAFERSAR